MSTDQDNKIRLNQSRRQAVQRRSNRTDNIPTRAGERGSPERDSINKIRLSKHRKLYRGKNGDAKTDNKRKAGHAIHNVKVVAKKIKNTVTAPTKINIATDIPIYGTAFALAGLKDLLDLAGIGSLPGVGYVVTACISIAIAFVLMLDGVSSMQRKMARRMTQRFLVLCAGSLVEGLFVGLNLLPLELLTVALIYWMSLVDRKNEQK